MKSESNEPSSASRPPTEPSTPETASVAESTTANHSVEGTNESTTSTLTAQSSSSSSSDRDSTKKGKKSKGEDKGEGKKGGKGSNLVGKITNLVSTDLNNIVDGRDFPMLFISLPLQIVLCIVFLYKLLGWSAIVGMGVMLALYPLPGWVASKMQGVQKEKMKMVGHSPFALCNTASLRYIFSADGCACSGCDRGHERHPHDQGVRLGKTDRREDRRQA